MGREPAGVARRAAVPVTAITTAERAAGPPRPGRSQGPHRTR